MFSSWIDISPHMRCTNAAEESLACFVAASMRAINSTRALFSWFRSSSCRLAPEVDFLSRRFGSPRPRLSMYF